MRPLYKVAVSPKDGSRYHNTEKINGKDFIVNSSIDEKDYKYSQRIGVVEKLPHYKGNIQLEVGDEVIVHHNVFRKYWGHGVDLRNGDAYFKKNEYLCGPDQIFAYNRGDGWVCLGDYCFVEPVKEEDDVFMTDDYKERHGKVSISNMSLRELGINEGDTIVFSPYSEYVFNIDGKTIYKMSTKDIVGVTH